MMMAKACSYSYLNRWGDHYVPSLFKQGFHSFKKYNMAGCMLGRDKTCLWADIQGGESRDPWCEGKDDDANVFYLKETYALRPFHCNY